MRTVKQASHASFHSGLSTLYYLKAVEGAKFEADGRAIVCKIKELPAEDRRFVNS
jgi:hypothetical protein